MGGRGAVRSAIREKPLTRSIFLICLPSVDPSRFLPLGGLLPITMDKTAKASPRLVLEFIGISSIILSLVFVAVELNQNTKAVHGQTNQAIADNVNALYLAIATDDELARAWIKLFANERIEDLSSEERIVLEMSLLSGFRRVENIWYQVEEGLIEERALTRIGYDPYITSIGIATWNKFRGGYDPAFVSYFEQQIDMYIESEAAGYDEEVAQE